MALSSTAANITTQDGSGAVVNQSSGATITVAAGTILSVGLQSTSGIGIWNLEFQCPSYPALHQRNFEWRPGMPTTWAIPMPDYPVGGAQDANPLQGITLASSVSDSSGGAIVQSTYQVRTVATASIQALRARLLVAGALSAYTNTNGVITANANGALGSIDGTSVAVGDRLFLPPGIAASAGDVGIYQVTSLGSAGTPFVLTRSSDMPQGALMGSGSEVHIQSGSVYAGTIWVNISGDVVVGNAMTWMIRQLIQTITLVAGTVTITNCPLRSGLFGMTFTRTTPSGSGTTISYQPVGAITAGNLGTATFAFDATVGAGTIQNTDVSTGQLTIWNQC